MNFKFIYIATNYTFNISYGYAIFIEHVFFINAIQIY